MLREDSNHCSEKKNSLTVYPIYLPIKSNSILCLLPYVKDFNEGKITTKARPI
jgi:hypothetical protein